MGMPKRPSEHQVEDLSIIALKASLPRQWVYREKSRDYGIDGEVEIFDENDYATGIVFLIQLKATDQENPKKQRRVQLSNDTINYYKSLKLPVLIVRYVEKTKSLYTRWAHRIDRYGSKKGSQSFSFVMNDDELWTNETPNLIHTYLKKIDFLENATTLTPFNVYLDFTFKSKDHISPHKLKSYVREVTDKSQHISITINKADSICNVSITNDTLSTSFLEKGAIYFHSIDKIGYTKLSELGGDLFLSVTLSLIELNRISEAILIFDDLVKESLIINTPEVYLKLIKTIIEVGQANKAFELWESIPEENKTQIENTLFQMILSQSGKTDIYEKFLLSEISKFEYLGNDIHLGISLYNYANLLKCNGKLYEAFKRYKKALRFNPQYQKEDYIYKELGGVLFGLRRYGVSAKCYQNGLNIKSDPSTRALYADALMLKGDYRLSLEEFEKLFTEQEEPFSEWIIKATILDFIISQYDIASQKRNYIKSMSEPLLIEPWTSPKTDEEISYILSIDALSPLLWYNLAINNFDNENYEMAMGGFLICAVINENDIDAWYNAFISALKSNSLDLIQPILETGYYKSREVFINRIYDFLEPLEKSGKIDVQYMYDFLDEIIEKVRVDESVPLITRFFNGTNFVETSEK